jgi:hypothetical protein
MVLSVLIDMVLSVLRHWHGIVCPSSLTWYCLSFVIDMVLSVLIDMVLSVLPHWHGIVCPSSLTWYCLSFVIDMVLSVLRHWHGIVCPSSLTWYCLSFGDLPLLFIPFGIFKLHLHACKSRHLRKCWYWQRNVKSMTSVLYHVVWTNTFFLNMN